MRYINLHLTCDIGVKTTQARITKSSPTNSPMNLVFRIKNSSRNSKGFTPIKGVKWEWGRKNSHFSANNSSLLSQKRCNLLYNDKQELAYALSIGAKINDLGWLWTANKHSVAEKLRLSQPTIKIWMKIEPHYQRQKRRPMTLVFGGISFMRIFAEVPRGGGVKRQRGCQQRHFSAFSLAIFRIL